MKQKQKTFNPEPEVEVIAPAAEQKSEAVAEPTAPVPGFTLTCGQCLSMNVAVESSTLGDLVLYCATCGQRSHR